MKEELRCYQKRCTEKVENMSGQLRDTRDTLESLWKSVTDELRQTRDAEIITEYRAKEMKLWTAQCVDFEPMSHLSHIQLTERFPAQGNSIWSLRSRWLFK